MYIELEKIVSYYENNINDIIDYVTVGQGIYNSINVFYLRFDHQVMAYCWLLQRVNRALMSRLIIESDQVLNNKIVE